MLNCFWKYNEFKIKFKKKIVTRFDKKIATWRKNSIDDPIEESLAVDPEEEPITENSKGPYQRGP